MTEKISKGHIMFINSPPENCNLSLLQEGGGGQWTISYVPILLVPFRLGGRGVNENGPMSPSRQFFLEGIPNDTCKTHKLLGFWGEASKGFWGSKSFFTRPKHKKFIFSKKMTSEIWPNIGGGSHNGSVTQVPSDLLTQSKNKKFSCGPVSMTQSQQLAFTSLWCASVPGLGRNSHGSSSVSNLQ